MISLHPFTSTGISHAHNKRRALIARRVTALIADGVLPKPTERAKLTYDGESKRT